MITLTSPESRPSATTINLVSFTITSKLRYAEALYEVGYGSFNRTRTIRVVFADVTDVVAGTDTLGNQTFVFTFTALLNNVAQVAQLKQALEQQIVDRGVVSGTVS